MPSFSRRRAIDWWKGGLCMVGYVRWEEKRKRLTLRRCPLGDGEVCLLEGGGRLNRRVQRRVRQAAQAMADAGVRYAALLLPLRLPAPVALRRAMLGQLVDCACRQLGLCRSQASVVLRASRPDGAVTEAADLLARRVRYLSPQLGRGQEELRRSLRHRYGLGEGGPAAQLAACFGGGTALPADRRKPSGGTVCMGRAVAGKNEAVGSGGAAAGGAAGGGKPSAGCGCPGVGRT